MRLVVGGSSMRAVNGGCDNAHSKWRFIHLTFPQKLFRELKDKGERIIWRRFIAANDCDMNSRIGNEADGWLWKR